MKLKLTEEEKETMSYDDVAYVILKEYNKKIKIQELFKKVLKLMELPDSEFERGIGDFFELLITDKRFIMLDNGFCDLKINHSAKIIIDDDDEDFEISPTDELDDPLDEDEKEDNYDDDNIDDDTVEDDLDDLVIIDDGEETDPDML